MCISDWSSDVCSSDLRIKVWWEGNQRFFEADVLSYNFEDRKYQVFYLVDGNTQDEDLDGNAKWEVLDETQEEFRLLKGHSSQVCRHQPSLLHHLDNHLNMTPI